MSTFSNRLAYLRPPFPLRNQSLLSNTSLIFLASPSRL